MQRLMFQMGLTLALIFAGIWSTGTAFADKPDRGNGKKNKESYRQESRSERDQDNRDSGHREYYERNGREPERKEYFNEQRQIAIHQYYSDQFRKGHCPPGLVRKGNHCIPHGHAKMWKKGRPLPREVIFYDLPPSIIVHLGSPPPRHRFVRVAQDILLIAIGTGMVVDAFEDIGGQYDR